MATSDPQLGARGPADDSRRPFVTVVAGLPRSGTSMLMQMLAAGGLPIFTDGRRRADADNPKGYFEHEAATRLRRENAWLADATGSAVKIVAQLVPYLPGTWRYRVILIERRIDEVIASQARMLERLGPTGPDRDPAALRRTFEQQLREVKQWLEGRPNVQTLFVGHRGVLEDPLGTARCLDRFLGGPLDVQAMAAAVDPTLYRERR